MYYLCEKYYKLITVQYYIADCVSWVPRLTLLDLTNKLDLRMCSQNRTRLCVGVLLYTSSSYNSITKKHKQPNQKMGRRPKQTFLQMAFRHMKYAQHR